MTIHDSDTSLSGTAFAGSLDAQTDDALRALIARAHGLLDARKAQRRRQALAQIRNLAREHGLDVSVTKPAGKRGRPRKAQAGT